MFKKMDDIKERISCLIGTTPIPEEEKITIDTYSYYVNNAHYCNKQKIEFYKLNNISIRLRLKFKPEYEFIGKIIEVDDGRVILKDDKTPEVFIGLDEIDPETICPADINPILFW